MKLKTSIRQVDGIFFSIYLTPDTPDMKVLFRTLIDDSSLIKVQDQTGISLEDFGITN